MTHADVDDADPLLQLARRKGANWRTFVVPDAKLMYVQVNKNACTSLKWMIAGIAGEDLDAFGPSNEASTNHWDDIHDRRQWRHAPRLTQLDPGLRREIHPDNGWFVFSVTRDPRSRLFSAWQSKLLLNNPGYYGHRDRPWYPRHPASTNSIIEDFERFVTVFEKKPAIGLRRDGHFRDQVEMLHEDLVDYSTIYDIRELGRLVSELSSHLDAVGWRGELRLPRHNDTPLRANAAVFAGGVRERVEALYRVDFDRFGDRWDFATVDSVAPWLPEQIDEVNETAELGHRLGMLRSASIRAEKRAKDEHARAEEQGTRADRAEHRVRELEQQLRSAGTGDSWRGHLHADVERATAGLKRRVRRRRSSHA